MEQFDYDPRLSSGSQKIQNYSSSGALNRFFRRPLPISDQMRGFFYISINASLLAVTGVLFEFSLLNGTQMSFATSIVGTLLGVALFSIDNQVSSILDRKFSLAVLNGAINGGSIIFFLYSSMDKLGPAGATVIQIFTSIVASFVLEKFKLNKAPHFLSVLAVVLGVSGMVILCQNDSLSFDSFSIDYILGVVYGIIAGIFCAAFFHFIKVISHDIPDSWHWIAYMVGCAVPSAPLIYFNFASPSCDLSVTLCGVTAAVSQSICGLTAVKGFLLIKASAAFVFQLMASVMALALQLIFFPEMITVFSLLGALLIIAAIGLQFVVTTKIEQ